MSDLSIILDSQLQDYFIKYGYIGIYIWFITVDQIAPIPEEITLMVIGYFGVHGTISPIIAGLISILAFITIDSIYFYLTKTGSRFLHKVVDKLESPKMMKYKNKMIDHTFKTLLILCFIPRMRLLGPVFVALLKLSYGRFILFNSVSLAIFTTIYISLGMIFNKSLSTLISKSQFTGNIVFGIALIAMTILSIYIVHKLQKRKAK
jgi:membrane protein DedA with SNARE-associated domain